ncbi:major facilitator superfamily domain-containing protein 1-like [Mizuhopecten yessoensis]|uniref:Lysosomal dipeptide transporter MFSD1 n=1 Tax=Mizuhopecten yessoensis TaxID=6573 RepID=A0A210QQW8_MIZYE|nr:major facilitator superfamily domain-containing protein 1-like [Mizuhopecten yessoensis]OWF51136.1 Major facilitator superfamily domain-containing protein 1 [Mizuhopecten yessoensis]
MTALRRYGVLFCNSFLVFGVYYFLQIPICLQNEIMNSYHSYNGTNHTRDQTNCKVCLGLGELRYNMLFSVSRWTNIVLSVPLGFLVDRLGNGRSAILYSSLTLLGSVMFTVGTMSHAPVTSSMYMLMVTGSGLLAFGDGPLRFVQARVVAHCFPESTLSAMTISGFGYCGLAISYYVTPYVDTVAGLIPSVWLGVVACGIGVMCAVGLAFLLPLHPRLDEDDKDNKMFTLRDLRALPGSYWLYIIAIALNAASWIPKQANLPDYLMLRYGYTMIEASHINGLSPIMLLPGILACFLLKMVDCDGIMITFFMAWIVPLYALMGFYKDVNVIIVNLVDGIGIGISSIMMWQILMLMCPAKYVGSLAGLMFLLRNLNVAVIFLASGYILQRHNVESVEDALCYYQHFFLMLIIMASMSVVCGVVMNVLDIRKACALNSRLARWRKSNMETMGLMSMTEPSSQYCGTDRVNNNTVSED